MPTTTIPLAAGTGRRTITITASQITIDDEPVTPPLALTPHLSMHIPWPQIVKDTIVINHGFAFGDEVMLFPAYRDELDRLNRRCFGFLIIHLDDEIPGAWSVVSLALWVDGGSDADAQLFDTYAEAVAYAEKTIREEKFTIL